MNVHAHDVSATAGSDIRSLVRLFGLTGPHRGMVVRGTFFRFLQSAALGLSFAVAVWVVADLAEGRAVTAAWAAQASALMFCALAGQVLFGLLATRDCWISSHLVAGNLRMAMLERLRLLPMGFHLCRHKGDTVTALTGDMQMLEVFLAEGLPKIAQAIGLPFAVFCFLLATDWPAALIALAPILLAAPVFLWSSRRLAALAADRQGAQAEAAARMIDYVEGMKVIRAFNRLADGWTGFRAALDRFHAVSVRMIAALVVPMVGFAAIVMLGIPLVVALAGYRHVVGEIPAGTLVCVLGLLTTLYAPILSLLNVMETARTAEASLARMDDIFHAPLLPEPKTPARPNGFAVSFEGVGFAYVPGRPVLRNVSFAVPERSVVAVVGPSGSGKSTLLNLLSRFWEVGEGRITLGGVDLRAMRFEDLAAHIAVVFQDVYLFSGTIHDNIAEGRPGADRRAIEAAARGAQAHDFIMALPDGYETRVGEGGAMLSGGERQRISIARAILKDAPIVLLDEATAAIDPSNERAIQTALAGLARDRTLIVVAHRLSTIRNADHIVVLDGGVVAEQGTHDDLLARGGLYAHLWGLRNRAARWQIGDDETEARP
ncbi:ABC transporter ATP-binding protein [Shinella sp.]|uniref:ABC transporter ATP-binding protein n=1 Tax=Shinella sp. TaxID=1870904 RepID=UPI00258541F5|nr:ABC transporter ATP-binding protein [Shinella sp.]MCW5708998.1 ABC transporter ATP-binding protein [Shinella sp.]